MPASGFEPLRKNLGKRNCGLAPDDIERISRSFLDFKETPKSKIFPNAAFGYWKVTVERPLRRHSQLSPKAIESLRLPRVTKSCARRCTTSSAMTLFGQFDQVGAELEKRLAKCGTDDEEGQGDDGEDGAGAKKGLPEKRRKKLLDPKTWERDGRLVEVATALRVALGDGS